MWVPELMLRMESPLVHFARGWPHATPPVCEVQRAQDGLHKIFPVVTPPRRPMTPLVNTAAPLQAMARAQPGTPALVEPGGRRFTYRELDEDSDVLARGLEAVGVGRGVRTVLMVPPGLDFYSL